jgi:molybdate transport system substrate-binding protein
VCVLGSSALAAAEELTVSLAISTKDVVEHLGRRFTGSRPGVALRENLGASGELAKQIEAGAPVDVFLSAGETQMDELERRGLVDPASRHVFARNTLVVIVPSDGRLGLARPDDLLDRRVTRIVIGDPRIVPAGQYAEESLRALGLWDRLRPKLVLAENVRQALDYVSRGEVDAGFVYASDAALRPGRVREAFRPPDGSHRPILYPVAVVAGSRHAALARAFVAFLVSPESVTALARFGFLAPARGGSR